jgi:selenocysteine-specific elongation factor
VLVRAGEWAEATQFDAIVQRIPGAPARLPTRLRAAVGSGEHPVRVRLLDEDAGLARLRFDTPLPLGLGDRLVLRDPARARTIAGAEVLDVGSTRPAASAAAALRLAPLPRLLAGHGWLSRSDAARLADLDSIAAQLLVDDAVAAGDAVVVGQWLAPPADLDDLRADARRAVDAHHTAEPLSPGLELGALATTLRRPADHVRAALADDGTLRVEQGVVRDPARVRRAADTEEGRALVAQLDATPFAPPAPSDPDLARALVREGVLVDVEGILFTATAIARARATLRGALADGAAISVGDARELLASSRKYVVPLLGQFDREGFTRRRGDARVAGPRLASGAGDQP